MADQDVRHVCVHHVESYGMILLGDLVLDLYLQMAIAIKVTVGVSHGYTDHYQGRGQSSRPTAALINIHEPLI